MRPSGAIARTAVVLVCAGAVAAACGAQARGTTATAPARTELRSVPWRLVQSGANGRSLGIAYVVGGCTTAGRATVRESTSSVRIAVRARDDSGTGVVCPALIRCARLTVHLGKPIDGRRVLGAGRVYSACGRLTAARNGTLAVLVPRLLGLARGDAATVLHADGLAARTTGSGTRVVAQRPAPGRTAHGAVTLRLGR